MTTQESNKLIAEFMGWEKYEGYNYITAHYQSYQSVSNGLCETKVFSMTELKFHTSWDWLMPVTKKINELPKVGEWHKFDVIIEPNQTSISVTFDYDGIHKTFIKLWTEKYWLNAENKGSSINNTYILVVDFITWYNKNK